LFAAESFNHLADNNSTPVAHHFDYTVEFEDVDMEGMVHHHKIACYLERAVVHCYHDKLTIPIKTSAYVIVLSTLTLKCISPIKMADLPHVELIPIRVSRVTMEWEARVTDSRTQRLCAFAEIKHACIDTRSLRPLAWPAAVQTVLKNEVAGFRPAQ
jgi:acyl-CoA thioesterase FadM